MADPRVKQLKIKTGVVKRLHKEKCSYEKEAETQKAKVEKLQADKADEHDVRKQQEVLQETRAMVPDCMRRLQTAVQELKAITDAETDLSGSDEYKQALTVIGDAEKEIAK